MIRFVNRRAEEIIGAQHGELMGRPVREVCRSPTATATTGGISPIRGTASTSRKGHREKLLWTARGVEVLVTARYIRRGRGAPVHRVVMACRDALARQRTERDHAALISTLAHELRSPLTRSRGSPAPCSRTGTGSRDEQKRLIIETIEADADRVTRLIAELLDVSRIDSGRLDLRPGGVPRPGPRAHRSTAGRSRRHRERFVLDVADGCPRSGPTRTGSTRSSPTSSRTPCGTAAARCTVGRRADRARRRPGGATSTVADEGDGHPASTASRCSPVLARPGPRRHRPRALRRAGPVEGPRRRISAEIDDAPGGGAVVGRSSRPNPPDEDRLGTSRRGDRGCSPASSGARGSKRGG